MKKKVLLVDDEYMTRRVLKNKIDWHSFDAVVSGEAEDGEEALKMALEIQPDIIISDIRMPRMNGIELVQNLKEQLPLCKFILLTGYSDKEYLKSAIRLKIVSYVEKPINIKEITSVLYKAIEENEYEKKTLKKLRDRDINDICYKLTLPGRLSQDLFDMLNSLEMSLNKARFFCSCILSISDSNKLKKEVTNTLAKDINTLLSKLSIRAICSPRNDETIIIHLFLEHASLLEKFADELNMVFFDTKKANGNINFIHAGIGTTVDSLGHMYRSYNTAVTALQKVFYEENQTIIFYENDTTKPYEMDESIFIKLTEALKTVDRICAEIIIKGLTNNIRKHKNTHIGSVKDMFYRIILSINEVANTLNINLLKPDNNFSWNSISQASKLSELQAVVLSFLDNMFNELEKLYSKDTLSTKTIHYIKKNISDADLSINKISENLFITPTYLCAVFKKETKTTINQFIKDCRMKKAHEIISKKYIKNTELAFMVGYKDARYFSKTFEDYFGFKPKAIWERGVNEK